MKEDFLHYLWKFKKFDCLSLKTYNGEPITIINVGQYLELAGPDFFNAQLMIGDQKWAGNVEIHLKSSDWYLHHHERDEAYENVILHVVWEHDTEIFRKDNTEIPVLEIKSYVDPITLSNYESLVRPKSWIYCEKQLATVPEFVLKNWQERLFFERLERKSNAIEELLVLSNTDWEAVLFQMLAKNFGLNTNGEIFLKIAQSIPFSIIRKECFEIENLEALLVGQAGLLDVDKEDNYFKDLKFRYHYLLHKYQIEKKLFEPVQFFKHRPDNFPTIRLSQLAKLYHSQQNLFSKISSCKSVNAIYEVLDCTTSDYWENHYQFDKTSTNRKKKLTRSFIDLVIINTIIPIQFAYAKSQAREFSDKWLQFIDAIAPETNATLEKFNSFGIKSKSAMESQALLQLKTEYCVKGRCLECAIGLELLKKNDMDF